MKLMWMFLECERKPGENPKHMHRERAPTGPTCKEYLVNKPGVIEITPSHEVQPTLNIKTIHPCKYWGENKTRKAGVNSQQSFP